MRVAFLYNEASEDPAQLAEDGDPDRSPVVAALRELGHDVFPLACTLDLAAVRDRLRRLRPEVVFNRVESLGGSDALVVSLLVLLDSMGLPYTGCPAAPFLATTDKVFVKEKLAAAGLPTPRWEQHGKKISTSGAGLRFPCRCILKSVLEHASFALSDHSIVAVADREELAGLLDEREAEFGRPYFAEEYIDGREFNLAVWGGGEPEVLPPAEIDFSAFPAGKPRIVGHAAKFAEGSFEYENTPRRYDFPRADEELVERLKELAAACWRLFGFSGYARVDFRCDGEGRPWILEMNANPCISPTSGFAAAMEAAGIAYKQGIARLLGDAIDRAGRTAVGREMTHEQLITH